MSERPDAFVQAGGQSRRMGRNKALLELDGRTLIERVIGAVRPVAASVALIANDPAPYARFGVPVHPDRWPGSAALGGIGTAIGLAATPRCLVLACDLPFLTPELLEFLLAADPSADVTLFETEEDGLHPLCAAYAKRCLPHIEARIARGELKVAGFFGEVSVRRIGEAELSAAGFRPALLANLNTPEELARALSRPPPR